MWFCLKRRVLTSQQAIGLICSDSEHMRLAISIGEQSNAHKGIMARYYHGLAKALERQGKTSDSQRYAAVAKKSRSEMLEIPAGLDEDDESDTAYELCVKIDQR